MEKNKSKERMKKESDHKCHCHEDEKCTCGEHCECEDCNCDEHKQEINYLEIAQRIQAEFENYKKRNKEVVQESFANGISFSVEKLLPVLDSFKQAKLKITDENVLEGIDLIYFQLLSALTQLGVKKIECVNQKFDPFYHNAVMVDKKDDVEDGIVLEEFQEGFTLNGKVIRHSVVKINKL